MHISQAACDTCRDWLNKRMAWITRTEDITFDWTEKISLDELCSENKAVAACKRVFTEQRMHAELDREIANAKAKNRLKTAWRIEGTLREFPKFEPVNLWFDYPVHKIDNVGVLKDVEPEGEAPQWKKAIDSRKSKADKAKERKENLDIAIQACRNEGAVVFQDVVNYFNVVEKTVHRWIKESGKYIVSDGKIFEIKK